MQEADQTELELKCRMLNRYRQVQAAKVGFNAVSSLRMQVASWPLRN
jgi:hypothetical protein